MTKRSKSTTLVKKRKRNYDNKGLLFIAPWLLGFLALQLYPMLSSLYYSFTDYSMGTYFYKRSVFFPIREGNPDLCSCSRPAEAGICTVYRGNPEPEVKRNQLFPSRILHTVYTGGQHIDCNSVESAVHQRWIYQ